MNLGVDIETGATAVDHDRIVENRPLEILEGQPERQDDDRIRLEAGCCVY